MSGRPSNGATDELILEGERIRQKLAEVAAELGAFVKQLRGESEEARERDD